MNLLKIIISKHQETELDVIKKIVNLKNQHWLYTVEEHLIWIQNNIQNNDYHIRIENEYDNIVAYLNLVEIFIQFENQEPQSFLGIGNVCVDKSMEGSGLGLLLMQSTNYFLKQLNKKGSLICKPHLHAFYTKANWIKYEGEYFIASNKIEASIYFLNIQKAASLNINKNF